MARQSESTKKPRAKREPYVCDVCGEKKPPTHFPDPKAKTCTACGTLPSEPEPLPSQESAEKAAAGELFTSIAVEIDYDSPTAKEIAARTLARRRLLHFIKRFRPKYMAGWVHEDVCRRLERFMEQVALQQGPRLLLMMPYRSGKSEISSRHYAPWVVGHHPDWEIIAASNAQSLATSFSRYIRDLMRDPSYKALFPSAQLDPSSQAVENWNTTMGGGYLAAGAGSAIIGRGAHVLILDDLFRNSEEADSQVIRDNIWEWYLSTAYSRLAPGGGVLGITTCWNEDDWAGRIIQAMEADGDKFEVVRYPAINDQGDEYILEDDSIVQIPPGLSVPAGAKLTRPMNTALHPERYTYDMLMKVKKAYYALGNQRWWAAGYQQNPTPEEGAFFKKDMFQYYGALPQRRHCNVYQAWDFSITEKETSDWIVGTTLYQDEHNNLYVADVRRFKQDDGIELIEEVVRYAKEWDADLLGFEDGQIWKSLASTFEVTCDKMQFYPSYEVLVPLTDKRVRAQPLRGRMQNRKVFHPREERAPWMLEHKNELLRFQAGGKHDDQVDSLAWAVRLTLSQAAPKPPEPPKLPSWKDRLGQYEEGEAGSSHMSA